MAERLDPALARATGPFLVRVADAFPVVGAMLFGSRARNDHHQDSDADVAVILAGSGGDFVETKLAMADIAFDVLLETGILIQPLPVWETEWNDPRSSRNPQLLEVISHDGISL